MSEPIIFHVFHVPNLEALKTGVGVITKDVEVNREDIVAVEPDEVDPDEILIVYTESGEQYVYALLTEEEEGYEERLEEQEWLLSFAVSHDYAN